MNDNNPCRNCGMEYPHRMRTAADTPPEQVEMLALLAEIELHLKWARVFITTREKSHPCGVDLHDELLAKVTAAIEAA